MKRLIALIAVLSLLASANTWASGFVVGGFDGHVAAHHARACGTPTTGVTWTPLRGVQHFRSCKIVASYRVIAVTPRPGATSRPTTAPTPIPSPSVSLPGGATATPLPPATPTSTSSPVPSASDPVSYRLAEINAERALHNYPALTLNATQSAQAVLHSQAMAASGSIWHVNPAYPLESFPAEIVVHYGAGGAGENVAATGSYGNVDADLDIINNLYLYSAGETWSPGCSGNHHCNIDAPWFKEVGIGIVQANGATWETEDFIG